MAADTERRQSDYGAFAVQLPYADPVDEIAARARKLPAPPRVVWESPTDLAVPADDRG